MAAYAAVISLKHDIQQHLKHPTIDLNIKKSAIDKLEYLGGLFQALDIKSNDQSFDVCAIKALDEEIRKAVWKLEDAFDSYAFNYNSSRCRSRSLQPGSDINIINGCQQMMQIALVDENGVEQEIHSFIQTVEVLGLQFNTLLDHPLVDGDEDVDAPIPADFGGNKSTSIEELSEDEFEKFVSKELVDAQYELKAVTLFGMAGIGKTHFAREIYQRPQIVDYFDFTAWVRVGQKGRVKSILVDIVSQLERKPKNIYLDENMYTLGLLLRKNLDNRKCLIVLDDVWSEMVCHDIICRLREVGVRRVLLTTRLRHINKYEHTEFHEMRFLDNEESWNLLWRNVFADRSSFPPQLEKVGRKIAAKCEGLPLLIIVVAHLLRGADDKTQEYWNKVAGKKTSTFVDAYEKISQVLFSSYEYLPEQLKACFLYMGVFPESGEIPVSKLINLWAVEDFVEPNSEYKTVECVKKLVSNSLVIICKQGYYRIKSCKLHSAYWYLCVKEARKNKFFHVLNKLTDGAQEYIEGQRRLSVQNSILFGIKEAHESMAGASTARSLLCTGDQDHEYPVPICFNLMLLRVLDAFSIRLYEFPEEAVKLLLLRYLSLTHNGKLPRSISNLQYLQSLLLSQHHNIKLLSDSNSTFLPEEIWDMHQLKHLRIMGHNLPDPSNFDSKLPQLSTLYVNARSCTEAVFRSIPKLKKLGIAIELPPDDVAAACCCFEHIGVLDELESLKCVVVNPWVRSSHVVAPPAQLSKLRWRLRKLSLNGLGYSWDGMTAIASIWGLRVLKLQCCAFRGPEWKAEYEGLSKLEFLLLEDIDLVDWTAYKYNCFSRLKRLTIRHCFKLKEIPPRIAALKNLKMVELVDCSQSLVASAKRIHDERKSSFQLVINSSWSL